MSDTKIEVPIHLRILSRLFGLVANRYIAILISILILITGYLIDSYLKESTVFSASSAIVTVFGLVLTIKHNYLTNISSLENLVASHYQESSFNSSIQDVMKDEVYVKELFNKATDEGIGLILILVSTGLNAFGSYIPLLDLCSKT